MKDPDFKLCNNCFIDNNSSCIENLDEISIPDAFISKNCRELQKLKLIELVNIAKPVMENRRSNAANWGCLCRLPIDPDLPLIDCILCSVTKWLERVKKLKK